MLADKLKAEWHAQVVQILRHFSFNVSNIQTVIAENRYPKDTQSGCKRHTKL